MTTIWMMILICNLIKSMENFLKKLKFKSLLDWINSIYYDKLMRDARGNIIVRSKNKIVKSRFENLRYRINMGVVDSKKIKKLKN